MTEKIRILVVLPVVYTEGLKGALEDRRKLAEAIDHRTGGLVKLDAVSLDKGTASIEDAYDEAINTPYILEKVKKAEEEGHNAVVIDCFGDPGLDAARELVSIPVLGANEASCHLAAQLAPRFSIINILPETEHLVRGLAVKYGLLQYLASMITINIPVLALEEEPEKTIAAITQAAEKAVKEDGAYAIVLGCTGMSSLIEGVKSQLEAKGIKIPVIEPLRAAIYTAIAWVLMGASHSKEAYRPPRPKLRKLP
jgi:allantoin racemase